MERRGEEEPRRLGVIPSCRHDFSLLEGFSLRPHRRHGSSRKVFHACHAKVPMKIGAMMLLVSVRKLSPTATAENQIHKVIRIRFGPEQRIEHPSAVER
ncbi:MAG: hypothetical protein H7A50_06865 [Akkermansiaceae bacterium]|nr:hypothetical protein [Akkermansiaceae bacterium]